MKENHREILVVSNAKGKKFSLVETDNNYIVACGKMGTAVGTRNILHVFK